MHNATEQSVADVSKPKIFIRLQYIIFESFNFFICLNGISIDYNILGQLYLLELGITVTNGFIKRKKTVNILSAVIFTLILNLNTVFAKNTPIFLVYHRFGESSYPSTNTTIKQLESHIKELQKKKYTVLPIDKIMEKIKSGQNLKDRTIGISIDDGYKSIYEVAWPRFREANLPFTVFLSTKSIDQKNKNSLTWSQIREMKNQGVIFGNHSHSHLHMPNNKISINANDISLANRRFNAEIGITPSLFAYPYGEFSRELENLVKKYNFDAAFGQHSGVMSSLSNLFSIPRFSLNEQFGAIERFKLVINALPFSISDLTPWQHLVTKSNPPLIGFTFDDKKSKLDSLQCFTSNNGRAKLERLGDNRIEVRANQPFAKGRTRLNCTMRDKNNRWQWFGRMFFYPQT